MEYQFGDNEEEYGKLREAADLLKQTQFAVALTGAGISRASGLPVMDDSAAARQAESLFDPQVLATRPADYFARYRQTLLSWQPVDPNAAHVSLARANIPVITLNVDGLHRKAGSRQLIEMHGNLRELRCLTCGGIFPSTLVMAESPPYCPDCRIMLRPGLSLQGEEIRHFSLALDWVGRAQVLLIIGTSLRTSPANRLPEVARQNQATLMVVNDRADTVIPQLFAKTKR